MSEFTIKTDHKWKNFRYENEVPTKIRTSQFDYLNEDNGGCDGYFRYRGYWYHISDFEANPPYALQAQGWGGWHIDSFYSGVAIRCSANGEQYKIATVLA